MSSEDLIEIKIVTLGDAVVGKSSILFRYINNCWEENLPPTIGGSFMVKVKEYQGLKFKYQIWDTAGSEKFHSIAQLYYRDAQVAILVYDVTNEVSFKQLKSWVKELRENSGSNVFIIIAGNKYDLIETKQPGFTEVPFDAVQKYAEEINAQVVLTSAKTGRGIEELFDRISQYVYNQNKELYIKKPNNAQKISDKASKKEKSPGKGGCC